MSDYISRADAIDAVRKVFNKGGGDLAEAIMSVPSADSVSRDVHVGIVNELVKRIEELKADSVKVVRCKDCRHGWYDDDIEYYVYRHPKGLNEELYGVDYCSYGQTKEQDHKLPGYDGIMERLDRLTLKGGDDK